MKKLLTAFMLAAAIVTRAQSLNHVGVMPTIDHSGSISNKWDYSLYYFGMVNLYNDKVGGIRDNANIFAFYSEQAISFRVTPSLSLTASYVYERQRPLETTYRNENRFYLQGTYRYSLGKTGIKHRLRYDGRFIQNRFTGEAAFSGRLRYLTGITTPLTKNGDRYLTAYNEFFFNTSKGSNTIYGENWAYAALGFKTGKNSSIEAGPLYVFWVIDNKNTLNNFYYFQLTWVSHLDLTKDKK